MLLRTNLKIAIAKSLVVYNYFINGQVTIVTLTVMNTQSNSFRYSSGKAPNNGYPCHHLNFWIAIKQSSKVFMCILQSLLAYCHVAVVPL